MGRFDHHRHRRGLRDPLSGGRPPGKGEKVAALMVTGVSVMQAGRKRMKEAMAGAHLG
jgi:hypothetical protein